MTALAAHQANADDPRKLLAVYQAVVGDDTNGTLRLMRQNGEWQVFAVTEPEHERCLSELADGVCL